MILSFSEWNGTMLLYQFNWKYSILHFKLFHSLGWTCSLLTIDMKYISSHRWFSGRMLACHAGGPGSIPGRCKLFWKYSCKIINRIRNFPRHRSAARFILFYVTSYTLYGCSNVSWNLVNSSLNVFNNIFDRVRNLYTGG